MAPGSVSLMGELDEGNHDGSLRAESYRVTEEPVASAEQATAPTLGALISRLREERERALQDEIDEIVRDLREDIQEAYRQKKTKVDVRMPHQLLPDILADDADRTTFIASRLPPFGQAVHERLLQEQVPQTCIVIKRATSDTSSRLCKMVILLP